MLAGVLKNAGVITTYCPVGPPTQMLKAQVTSAPGECSLQLPILLQHSLKPIAQGWEIL